VISKHFIQIIEKMAYEHASFEPKHEAVADFEENHRIFIYRTA
jgi:hypothetical protein